MRKILIFVSIVLPELIFAQGELWVSRYNGPADTSDYASSIAADGLGNVYVTGYSYGSGAYADYATIKYNSLGDTVWVRRYNGTGDSTDWGFAVTVDVFGNVYVTGASYGIGSGYDYLTIKYNSSGDTVWTGRYNGPGDSSDIPTGIAVDASGNVYAAGRSYGFGTDYDYLIIKYDSAGGTVWARRYNGSGNGMDWLSGIALDNSGNVYVTGYSYNLGGNDYYLTIKYDSAGDTLWVMEHKEAGVHNDRAYAIAVDTFGNAYVTGENGAGTAYDYMTIKYDLSGDTVWTRRYDGPANYYDRAVAIAVDALENVYVTGSSYGLGTEYDYGVVKYDLSGNVVWVKRYDGPKNLGDEAYGIAVDDSGSVYVTGYSYGLTSFLDFATIKYDSAGDTVWVRRYNGTGNVWDEGYCVVADNAGGVYVTGYSYGSGTYADYLTIKYSGSGAGVEEQGTENSKQLAVIISQNPVFQSTIISYQLSIKSKILLSVYDISGRRVRTLVDGEKGAGSYSINFDAQGGSDQGGDAGGLVSGTYFIQLKTNGSIITKKVTILN